MTIKLDQTARLYCDEPRCEESVRVRLVLLMAGQLAPDMPADALGKGWQVFGDQQDPTAPFRGRCPFHAKSATRILKPTAGLA